MEVSPSQEQQTKTAAHESRQWLSRIAIAWRREPVIRKILAPTNPERARRLGYKKRRGIIVVRIRVRKGGARKPRPVSGRRQKALGISKFTRAISIQEIAEKRAAKRYPNLMIKNSYHVFSDGVSHWYEVILDNAG